jgi:class 3 adenylate cyclase/DNA-binding winged helix-turn-helix (wHTH) protein/predicted ATPase
MVYRFHDYTLDEARRELWRTRQLVAVEPKVFQVLLYLLQHRDRMVSKEELLEQCWPETFVSESALTRCLTKLRKAVQADGTAPPIIKTLHGHGYRFVADVTLLPPASSPEAVSSPKVRHTPPSAASTPVGSLAPAVPPSEHQIRLELPTPPREPLSAAERRQLTVLFCDLVGSTTLADRLDPEDFREITVTYQTTCAEVIRRYGGHIAQYLGDGLLVYFGYPAAHEDDAQHAIHAGLDMFSALVDLNRRLVQPYGIRLSARLGIHTGLVVVGEVGGGPQYGQLALGVTPNIAAKMQTMGAPDRMVISGATYRLVQGYFVCQDLGEHTLPGVMEPLSLYQVLHVSDARGRLETASAGGLTPLVGRDAEMVLLRERWAQVQQGIGQVVMLSGEAGIGKSRLVRALIERLGETPLTRLECRCSPYYQYTALYPVVDLLQRSLRFDSTTPPDEKIIRLEGLLHEHQLDLHENLPLLASLLSLPPPADRYPPLQMSPQQQRQRTLDTLLGLTLALARQQPVLFIVEDLHWIDPSTARELCQQTEETIQLFPVQWGLWSCYLVQAKQQLAREVGTQLLSLSQHVQDSTFVLEAHLALAWSLPDLGEFTPARHHWDHSLACYDRQQHRSQIMHFGMDLGVFSRAWMSHTLWHLGYPDQARTRSHEALALAEEHAHPFSQAIALAYAVMLHQFRHEQHTVYEHADTALALCTEQGFAYYLAWGTIIQGWSLVVQGQREAGIEQMRQGLAALRSTDAKRGLPYYLALLAEGYGAVGQTDEGLGVLDEAFAEVATTAERRWEAELYRLQGELLLRAKGRRRNGRQKRVSARRLRSHASSRQRRWNYAPP